MPSRLLFAIALSIFLKSVSVFAQPASGALITDPSISSRCKGMLQQREELQGIKQKLAALKKRNEKIIKNTPDEKKSLLDKAGKTKKLIAKEIDLNQLKLQHIEEEIIKNGCPGISR